MDKVEKAPVGTTDQTARIAEALRHAAESNQRLSESTLREAADLLTVQQTALEQAERQRDDMILLVKRDWETGGEPSGQTWHEEAE